MALAGGPSFTSAMVFKFSNLYSRVDTIDGRIRLLKITEWVNANTSVRTARGFGRRWMVLVQERVWPISIVDRHFDVAQVTFSLFAQLF